MKAQRGFTLLELLLVMAIMGVLMALLLPAILKFQDKSKAKRANARVIAIEAAVQAYRLRYHVWPAVDSHMSAGVDVTYGTTGYDNGVVFRKLTYPPDGNSSGADDPLIDINDFALDSNGNGICYLGTQFKITFDLNEDFSPSGGVSVSY